MRVALAIIVTAAVLAAGYVISALAGMDVFWIIIPLTALWVAVDSAKLQIIRYKVLLDARPVPLFCLCALLWIFIFPLYLETRGRVKGGIASLKEQTGGSPVRLFFHKMSKAATVTAEWLVVIVYGLKLCLFLFLAEECWRGAKMWNRFQHDLAAKGETLELKAMTPSPVREADNFFSAPRMAEWFVKSPDKNKNPKELANRLNGNHFTEEAKIAELTLRVGKPAAATSADPALRIDDPQLNRRVLEHISSFAGPCALTAASNYVLITRPLNLSQIKPREFEIEAERKPTAQELIALLNNREGGGVLTIKAAGNNKYYVYAAFCQASNFLTWSTQFGTEFTLMREAVKRPHARMDGGYHDPLLFPVPNFYSYRAVCQTLAQRAQCYLLLGQPENALREIALLHALRHTLEGVPAGKATSLVATMTDAAVAGLETTVIADGFRLRAWQKPQIVALQKQLEGINLPPLLTDSLRTERATLWNLFQNRLLSRFEAPPIANATFEQKLKKVRPFNILSGIFYINMINTANLVQTAMGGVDPARRAVKPQRFAEFWSEEERMSRHPYPYSVYASIAVPNYTRAAQNLAFAQAKADEAQIACALEQYRLARGNYPDALDQLVPQFIAKLPHDVIGGGPLRYRRESDGQFMLYSIAWDETDNGGRVSLASGNHGDWVWQ